MEKPIGVRKGAWTEEEDRLLKACIEKHGEGKWHQVPLKAGLNRCRKSCRLRWLNYLRPNIKRGEFTDDEINMFMRLHKLLGNRWSLIAGRLPGRTTNDVKNYWNTHLRGGRDHDHVFGRRSADPKAGKITQKIITKSNIHRPRPRIFSKKVFFPVEKTTSTTPMTTDHVSKDTTTLWPPSNKDEDEFMWFESFLNEENYQVCQNQTINNSKLGQDEVQATTTTSISSKHCCDSHSGTGQELVGETYFFPQEENNNYWTLLSTFDKDLVGNIDDFNSANCDHEFQTLGTSFLFGP